MNKHESSSNLIVGIIILGVVLCLLKDFISIKSYKLPIGAGEEGKFYSGILLDGYIKMITDLRGKNIANQKIIRLEKRLNLNTD